MKMNRLAVQLAFVTTTSESFKQIKLWIDYHKSIGVNHFYLFVDGQVCECFLLVHWLHYCCKTPIEA